jgi:hypothetical protein
MPAVTIPYTAAQSAQIAPVAHSVHGSLRTPSVVPPELSGPVTVRVPGRGAALYEITIGPRCATDACYNVRVQAFPLGGSLDEPSDLVRTDLPDGGLGYYHLNEHFSTMRVAYPGQGFQSYIIDCSCDFDQLNAIARGLKPAAVY